MIEENECITIEFVYNGYYLNFLRFGTSYSRVGDWGAQSGNNFYSPHGDEGTCLSQIEVTASSSWNRLVSVRFAFERTTDYSTSSKPDASVPLDVDQHSTGTLADTGCDGMQFLVDNATFYVPAGVCSVVKDSH
eukprot:879665_1